MTSIIETHKTQIAALGATVSGMKKAFTLAPPKLDTAELPALLSFTSQAPYDDTEYGTNIRKIERVYRIQCFVIPIGQATPELREQKVPPLLEACIDLFSNYPQLNHCTGVLRTTVLSDSGIVILPEYGASFVGFEIRLEVQYLYKRTYKE